MSNPAPTLAESRQRLLLAFLQLEAALVAAGFHSTSKFMLNELLRFVQACVPSWVWTIGRRGGKSSTIARLGVAQAVYGDWEVPPGDVGVVAIVSVSLAEAKQRLKTIREILDAIGEPYSATAERIRLRRRPAEFRALACSLQGVVGFSAIAIFVDEAAHLRDDTGSNPAREVVDKLSPATATCPTALTVLASAPDSVNTYHHERFSLGDTDQQITTHAPTWVANPTLTEEMCRQLAPSDRVFEREYGAIAQEQGSEPVFSKDAIMRALHRNTDRGRPMGKRVICLDPSSGTGGDAFTWIAAGWNERSNGDRVLSVDHADGQRGPFHTQVRPDELVRTRVRAVAYQHGADEVFSDQHLAPLVEAECRRLHLRFQSFAFTHEIKLDAVRKLALMLEQDQIVFPYGHGWIRKELLQYVEKTSRAGKVRHEAKGKRHDDIVSAILILMIVDSKGLLEGSPGHRIRRNDPPPFAGGKLESWAWTQPASSPADQVQIGPDGRAYYRRGGPGGGSALGGGGF